MKTEQLKYIFNQFAHKGVFESVHELSSGHINDTFLITTTQKPFYILQCINHNVFKDVPGLIENKIKVSNHIKSKFSQFSKSEVESQNVHFYLTRVGDSYYTDPQGNFWNLMRYIDESVTYETVPNKQIAYEGGRLLAQFLNLTSDFDSSELIEVIPKFHEMSFRYDEFDESKTIACPKRLELAEPYMVSAENYRKEMHILENLKKSGKIGLRVTHNDTKISNVLFDKEDKGICLIDLDTVMPGIIHYDYGDAIRTICNTAAEDEPDLDKVAFNLEYYDAFTKGFLKHMDQSLPALEKKYLPLAAKTMIFIMALRFLTDYLNGDIYYKTKYPEHNLNRAKNQFKLLESLSEKLKI